MELYLLRHGRSYANEKKLVTGSRADGLSPEGANQARSARRLLKKLGLGDPAVHCVVSDWQRARETAALAAPAQTFVLDARLGETDAGTVADMPLETFAREHPYFWKKFDPLCAYPGGESHQQLYDRVQSWFEEAEATFPPDARIFAVTHAGPICCLLHAVCKVPMKDFPAFLPSNVSMTKLERRDGEAWRLAFFSFSPEMMA
jgi:broad specificity phosphatase PhoE